MEIQLYDLVRAQKPLSVLVAAGTIGTVLMIYDDSSPVAYEIEFVDDKSQTLEVLTVSSDKIEKIDNSYKIRFVC